MGDFTSKAAPGSTGDSARVSAASLLADHNFQLGLLGAVVVASGIGAWMGRSMKGALRGSLVALFAGAACLLVPDHISKVVGKVETLFKGKAATETTDGPVRDAARGARSRKSSAGVDRSRIGKVTVLPDPVPHSKPVGYQDRRVERADGGFETRRDVILDPAPTGMVAPNDPIVVGAKIMGEAADKVRGLVDVAARNPLMTLFLIEVALMTLTDHSTAARGRRIAERALT